MISLKYKNNITTGFTYNLLFNYSEKTWLSLTLFILQTIIILENLLQIIVNLQYTCKRI